MHLHQPSDDARNKRRAAAIDLAVKIATAVAFELLRRIGDQFWQ